MVFNYRCFAAASKQALREVSLMTLIFDGHLELKSEFVVVFTLPNCCCVVEANLQLAH